MRKITLLILVLAFVLSFGITASAGTLYNNIRLSVDGSTYDDVVNDSYYYGAATQGRNYCGIDSGDSWRCGTRLGSSTISGYDWIRAGESDYYTYNISMPYSATVTLRGRGNTDQASNTYHYVGGTFYSKHY